MSGAGGDNARLGFAPAAFKRSAKASATSLSPVVKRFGQSAVPSFSVAASGVGVLRQFRQTNSDGERQ
jgi:hypothetical protein